MDGIETQAEKPFKVRNISWDRKELSNRWKKNVSFPRLSYLPLKIIKVTVLTEDS